MIKLIIRNSNLIVQDESKEIFNWKHRAFFNIALEFEADELNSCYFHSEKNEFQNIVKEIVGYLKEEGVEFSADKQVEELISKIQNQETEFDEAKENLDAKIIIEQSSSFKRELKPLSNKRSRTFL
jgi:uncharacterized FAD-dependent dehydrogenase